MVIILKPKKMKKSLLLITSVLFASSQIFAQQQIPNPSFEEWDDEGTATMEPKHWNSLKTADALASMAPSVLSRDDGRTGDYSMKLEVKSAFGIQANGIASTGRIHADMDPENGYVFTDATDDRWNMPFTDRPDSLTGWYKYNPKNNDKAKVEVLLHKGPHGQLPMDATTEANLIGHARFDVTDSVAEWTRFSMPITYNNEETPDYLLLVVTSGDSTLAKTGSMIWVDDFEFIYNDESEEPTDPEEPSDSVSIKEHLELAKDYHVFANNGKIVFDEKLNNQDLYNIFDLSGRLIQSGNVQREVPFKQNAGLYIIKVQSSKGIFTKKILVK